jgi:hypothetical protein
VRELRSASDAAGDTLRQSNSKSAMLRTTILMPWHHYTVEEWFGDVAEKCVDYETPEALPLGLKLLRADLNSK